MEINRFEKLVINTVDCSSILFCIDESLLSLSKPVHRSFEGFLHKNKLNVKTVNRQISTDPFFIIDQKNLFKTFYTVAFLANNDLVLINADIQIKCETDPYYKLLLWLQSCIEHIFLFHGRPLEIEFLQNEFDRIQTKDNPSNFLSISSSAKSLVKENDVLQPFQIWESKIIEQPMT
jgi:hypothetical protein